MDNRHKKRKNAHNRKDLVGQRFGKLIVLSDTGNKLYRRVQYLCKCDCGNETLANSKYLLCGDKNSCGCITKGNAHNRTGYKGISGCYWYAIKAGAKQRGMSFNVTIEELWALFESQNKKCALTGVDIVFAVNFRDDNKTQTASLDRIDNSKGYTIDNVQWVHKTINRIRNKLSISEFKNWCSLVTVQLLTR